MNRLVITGSPTQLSKLKKFARAFKVVVCEEISERNESSSPSLPNNSSDTNDENGGTTENGTANAGTADDNSADNADVESVTESKSKTGNKKK